jgi:hypothetical protein
MTDTCTAPKPGLTGYKVHRCRCTMCTAANRDYANRRDRLLAYNRWQPFTAAQPVRDHINNTLRPSGLGVRRIAELAGVPFGTIQNLLWRKSCRDRSLRMLPERAAAILALQPDPEHAAGGTLVDAAGTRRRADALYAIGWTYSEQARRVGRNVSPYTESLRQQRVTARIAREVKALYEQLAGTPAPDSWITRRTVNRARRLGLASPAAWDDDTIDDPDAQPNYGHDQPAGDDHADEVLVAEVLWGRRKFTNLDDVLNPAEQVELWRQWTAARERAGEDGLGVNAFRARFGVSVHKVTALRTAAAGGTHPEQSEQKEAA